MTASLATLVLAEPLRRGQENCDHGQGFLFSQPLPPTVIEQTLKGSPHLDELVRQG
jgi:hypothetical protein